MKACNAPQAAHNKNYSVNIHDVNKDMSNGDRNSYNQSIKMATSAMGNAGAAIMSSGQKVSRQMPGLVSNDIRSNISDMSANNIPGGMTQYQGLNNSY